MADVKLGKAVLTLEIDGTQYKAALGDVDKASKKTADSIRGIEQAVNLAVFREFGQVAYKAVSLVAGAIVELGTRGAEVDDVASSFDTLTAKTGETADAMLGELRAGVRGTLSDFELMKLANKTLGSGLVKSAEEMGVLSAGARALAKATGGTTKEAFDTLTSAMASGRTAQLKQLGLFVDSKVATEDFARAHGKTAAQLTDADRAQALAAASLAALRQRLKEIPPDAADFGELIDAAKVRVSNFTDQLSVAVSRSPVFRAAMVAAGAAVDSAFGARQAETIDGTLRALEQFSIGAVDVGRIVLEVAKFIATGFEGVKVGVNLLVGETAGAVQTVALFFKAIADQAAKLPVIGGHYAGLSKELQGVADTAGSVAFNFRALADEQLDDTAKMRGAFEVVDGVLVRVRDSMAAALNSARDAGAGTSDAMGAMGAAAERERPRVEENVKAIADAYRKLLEEVVVGTKVGLEKRLVELAFAQQREIDQLRQLKEITAAELDARILLVNEKYAQLIQAAQLAGDQIRQKEVELQQAITLNQMTESQKRLAQLAIARDKELQQLAVMVGGYNERYMQLAALVQVGYEQMTAAATGHFLTVEQGAEAAGFKTRAELQATADKAVALYEAMKASGEFNAVELQKAFEAAEEAKRKATQTTKDYNLTAGQAWMEGTQQVLGVLGEKHKAAAIAGAIIATYAAVAKAMASAPWPANLALAAGALAAGMANVNKIRQSSPGYKEGTPGLDFASFGRMTTTQLHGQEAVIPRGGGHLLAGEIAAAMPGDGGTAQLALLQRIIELLEGEHPRSTAKALRAAMVTG